MNSLRVRAAYSVRIVDAREHEWIGFLAFLVHWFSYFNSSGNWIFYGALNRDLTTAIRFDLCEYFPNDPTFPGPALSVANGPPCRTPKSHRAVRRAALPSPAALDTFAVPCVAQRYTLCDCFTR